MDVSSWEVRTEFDTSSFPFTMEMSKSMVLRMSDVLCTALHYLETICPAPMITLNLSSKE